MFKKLFKGCCGGSNQATKSIKKRPKENREPQTEEKPKKKSSKKKNKESNDCTICFEEFDYYQHKFIKKQCEKMLARTAEEGKDGENTTEYAIIYQKDKKDAKEEKPRKMPNQNKFSKNSSLKLYTIKKEEFAYSSEEVLGLLEGEGICILPDCKHVFHKHCISSWLRQNNTCPVCRKEIYQADQIQQDGIEGLLAAGLLLRALIDNQIEEADRREHQRQRILLIPDPPLSPDVSSPDFDEFLSIHDQRIDDRNVFNFRLRQRPQISSIIRRRGEHPLIAIPSRLHRPLLHIPPRDMYGGGLNFPHGRHF
ncbi:unnamed protein product [Moneuplotes crassus]|uniref:RING-type domain-containing protein n=1 Tax=Euplotes crassus TaxID=5936 RepID=A0AAD1XFI9_EUPCR|nr:unnamed protein product [Moneuplotes crassus]